MWRDFLVLLGLLATARAACMVETDVENNIIADRIVGNWTFNADMTKLMGAEGTTKARFLNTRCKTQ